MLCWVSVFPFVLLFSMRKFEKGGASEPRTVNPIITKLMCMPQGKVILSTWFRCGPPFQISVYICLVQEAIIPLSVFPFYAQARRNTASTYGKNHIYYIVPYTCITS